MTGNHPAALLRRLNPYCALMNPLMIFIKIIKLR